jgi:gluconate 2-dehydrogenase gamma chain
MRLTVAAEPLAFAAEEVLMTDETERDESGALDRTTMTRATLLKAGAAVAAGSALLTGRAEASEVAVTPLALRFLTVWEFDYVTAMAETIWPTDELGPGARVAGVGYYIDGQLSGSWGRGNRFYLNGPFYTAADTGHGWQIPMTPAEVYRAFLAGFDVYCKSTYGNPYPSLTAAQQTQALTDLQANRAGIPISGSTAFRDADFYAMFRQNVLEGMLADPAYGGNQDMVGWKWLGFPGDPMRRGDKYHDYIFNSKPYPYENKPLPLQPTYAKESVSSGAARTGSETSGKATSTTTGGK